ncbi:MAG: hypothetical protein ACOX8W_12000 [bacterium]|jgi:hypothetical protein
MPTQELLRESLKIVFPDWSEYPRNSMTPAIVEYPFGSTVSFLILGQSDMVKHFYTEQDGTTKIAITISAKDNGDAADRNDLVIRFACAFPAAEVAWESVISGKMVKDQERLIRELDKQEHIFIFIADEFGEMIKIKRLKWEIGADEMMKMVDKNGQSDIVSKLLLSK